MGYGKLFHHKNIEDVMPKYQLNCVRKCTKYIDSFRNKMIIQISIRNMVDPMDLKSIPFPIIWSEILGIWKEVANLFICLLWKIFTMINPLKKDDLLLDTWKYNVWLYMSPVINPDVKWSKVFWELSWESMDQNAWNWYWICFLTNFRPE